MSPAAVPASALVGAENSQAERFNMTPAQARVVLERTAGTLAAAHGISVEFQEGACPQTDGRRIIIPPPNVTDWEEWLQVRGYIDHETSHILFTDMKEFEPLNDFQRLCLNALEDVRVNESMRERYAGARENLSGMYRRTIAGALKRKLAPPEPGQPPRPPIPAHMSKLGAMQIQLEGLGSLGAPDDLFGDEDGAVALAKAHAPKFRAAVDAAKDTRALVQAAKDLAQLIDPEKANQPPPPPKGGQGQDGEGDEEGEGTDNANQNPAAGDGQNQGTSDQPGCSPLDQASKEAIGDVGGGAGTYANARKRNARARTPEEIQRGRDRGHVDMIPEFRPWSEYQAFIARRGDTGHDAGKQASDLSLAMRLGAGLRDNLRQAMKARTMARKTRDQECGGLDINKLAVIAARVKDPAVFCKITPGVAVNTACHVLVDASASMDNPSSWPTCPAAAAIFADAAIGCGAVARVTTFDDPRVGHEWCAYGEKPTRNQWIQRMRLATPSGGTPTGNHIQAAARDILRRPESRKILVVVTDGAPDSSSYVEAMTRTARAAHVEVYTIGIGMDQSYARQALGAGAVGCRQPSDLRGVLLRILTRSLLREEGKGGHL